MYCKQTKFIYLFEKEMPLKDKLKQRLKIKNNIFFNVFEFCLSLYHIIGDAFFKNVCEYFPGLITTQTIFPVNEKDKFQY